MKKYKILFDRKELTITASGIAVADTGKSILLYKDGMLVGIVPVACAVYEIQEKESEI